MSLLDDLLAAGCVRADRTIRLAWALDRATEHDVSNLRREMRHAGKLTPAQADDLLRRFVFPLPTQDPEDPPLVAGSYRTGATCPKP